jgi:hypothetical protein
LPLPGVGKVKYLYQFPALLAILTLNPVAALWWRSSLSYALRRQTNKQTSELGFNMGPEAKFLAEIRTLRIQ